VNGERGTVKGERGAFTVYRLPFTMLLLGCSGTLPPLRGQIEVGRDRYAVFVAGSGMGGDLYAVRAEGGVPIPITFTNVAELSPALSPDGTELAFLRGLSLRDSTPATIWVMNLLNGAERELPLPKGASAPRRLGWGRGHTVVVETRDRLFSIHAPPSAPNPQAIPAAARAVAESSLAVLLGDPVFATVVPCETAGDLCVVADTGAPSLLARGAHDPLRWGADSVGFFVDDEVEVRPLARGRPRRLELSGAPARPRQMTFFAGKR
jgi:hypothetical protein